MFNHISQRYDRLNHYLSFGIHIFWRKKAISLLKKKQPQYILDIATGTGDLAIAAAQQLNPKKIIGIDLAQAMLAQARKKLAAKALTKKIKLLPGSSEALPFADATFDTVTIAFGVRNMGNLQKCLSEMYRVLQPQGTLVIIEFSQPTLPWFKPFYRLYLHHIVPTLGKWIAKNPAAYTYLSHSIFQFPSWQAFLAKLKAVGFQKTKCIPLTLGICSIYWAEKF